jgi:hypothetical protein
MQRIRILRLRNVAMRDYRLQIWAATARVSENKAFGILAG